VFDGRYKTMRALLLDSDGKRGATAGFSPADLDALEADLETRLLLEKPP
jgi:hypothetical protein